MIAEKSNALKEASESLYTLNADQMIREQCQAREDFYKIQRATDYKLKQLTSENVQLSSENKNLSATIQNQEALIQALQAQIPVFQK